MKKTLIAAGIAAVVAAPAAMADTTVYGQLRTAVVGGDGNSTVADYNNRFGFKGSEDLGNGLTAIYKMEFLVGADPSSTTSTTAVTGADGVTNRDKMVGLKGSFGTFMVGDMSSPQKLSMNVGKKFEDTIADRSFILSAEEGGYKTDAVAYVSPTVNGFHVAAALVADNSTSDTWAADSAALIYENGPLYVSVGYTDYDAAASNDSESVAVSYAMGDIKVSALYENNDDNDSSTTDGEENFYADLQYKMGNNTFIVGYGETDYDLAATADISVTTLAVEHSFSKRTNVMAIYNMKDNGGSNADVDNWAIQLNHSF